jgi:hypothetical protein
MIIQMILAQINEHPDIYPAVINSAKVDGMR